MTILKSLHSALLCLLVLCGLVPAQNNSPYVTLEPQWTALFERDSGWTGSDAVYSIPFSGYDAPGNAADDSTMFLFGDTFIGEVDETKARQNSVLIRNTIGILNTKSPLYNEMTFYWDTDGSGDPKALFEADTPESAEGEWIWPMDGININGRFYIYGLKLFDPPGFLGFEPNGVTLISFELDAGNKIINYTHVDAPLYYKDASDNEIVIGQAVMPMTAASGNPNPDGYIYVYGPRNRPLQVKQMVVARVPADSIENFASYRFWDGSGWQSSIENCAVITDSISQEFSMTPLSNGRFMATFEFDTWVCVRFADGLTGPFDPVHYLYECPEDTLYAGGFVYNAKAHPHLSDNGNMLISYNVNTSDVFELYDNADTYRPRFLTYQWNQDDASLPVSFDAASFSARYDPAGERALIEWRTHSEQNNLGFYLYRSGGGANMQLISGLIEGQGNSSIGADYTYEDPDLPPAEKLTYWLEQVDFSGKRTMYGPVELVVAASYGLDEPRPNPFNGKAQFSYYLPQSGHIEIALYNTIGQKMKTLFRGTQQAGKHFLRIDGNNLPSGVYYYRLKAAGTTLTRKCLLLK